MATSVSHLKVVLFRFGRAFSAFRLSLAHTRTHTTAAHIHRTTIKRWLSARDKVARQQYGETGQNERRGRKAARIDERITET